MTIHCWLEYIYYDGLWHFSQLYVAMSGDSPLRSTSVRWLSSEWVSV